MPVHQYQWSTEDLQELNTIIEDMKRDPYREINADTLTTWIRVYYPSAFHAHDYPYGVIADGYDQWQEWKRQGFNFDNLLVEEATTQEWTYQQSAQVYGQYRLAKARVEDLERVKRESPKDYEVAAHTYWLKMLAQATQSVRLSPPEIPGCNVWTCNSPAVDDGLCQCHIEDGRHDRFRTSQGWQPLELVVLS